jgi:lipid II:glycine glycyltransferase (peptidoglycan interpeptide bridge formation enzyme)
MDTRFANHDEISLWNKIILTNPDGGNNLQAKEFGKIKELGGWTSRFIICDEIKILVLEKKLPILGKIWYVPKGPGVKTIDELGKIAPDLIKFAKKHGVFLIRTEPELLANADNIDKKIAKFNLTKHKGVQVPNTVIVDIDRPIADVMAGFSSKTRYNIRAAQKAGVTTEIVTIDDKSCRDFFELMKVTVQGKAFQRRFEYYKKYWQSHSQANTGFFMYAKYNDEVLAMDFITHIGAKAVRKDAASPRERSVRGASALLELQVIEHLKTLDITEYDLCSCPPSSQIKNPQHPFFGVGKFKVGFNNEVTDYIGCLDMIINKRAYLVWNRLLEKLVLKMYYFIKKDLYY